MTQNDLPINDGGQPLEGVKNTTPLTPVQDDALDTGALEATLNTEEDILEAKRRAVTASIEKHKQLKVATAENERFKTEAQIFKSAASGDVNGLVHTLKSSYENNPQLVEEIVRENYNVSYGEIIQHLKQQNPQDTPDDVESIVERKLAAERQKREQEKIKKLEIDVLVKHDIDPESYTFRKIMEDYKRYPVTTAKDAKDLLGLLVEKHTNSSVRSATPEDIQRATGPKSKGTVTDKSVRKVSADARAIMVRKYGEEKTRAFLQGK